MPWSVWYIFKQQTFIHIDPLVRFEMKSTCYVNKVNTIFYRRRQMAKQKLHSTYRKITQRLYGHFIARFSPYLSRIKIKSSADIMLWNLQSSTPYLCQSKHYILIWNDTIKWAAFDMLTLSRNVKYYLRKHHRLTLVLYFINI